MTASPPDLSILVCAKDMARELPRVLHTLSAAYQRETGDLRWEIVVLDNGSAVPIDPSALAHILPEVRVVRPAHVSRSPAAAINAAMAQTTGRLTCLWIDGARLASPGVLRLACEAWAADPSRVIGTLAFHLGPDVQMRSIFDGYDAAREDALLASVPWQQDGYRLFDISVLAGSSTAGWFGCISETNGLFMDRQLWQAIGGLDERFQAPGGGFANLDLWERAVAASGGSPWMILGEGTFHQVHGGAATNGTAQDRAEMAAEYQTVHGRPFNRPQYHPRYVGSLDAARFASGAEKPLDCHRHVHAVRGQPFRIGLPPDALHRIQEGTLRTRYKGLRLAKNPFDLALYLRLLEQLRPATIIEIGTSEGGSAVWLRDQCRVLGLAETQVISIDLQPPDLTAEGIRFLAGNSLDPEGSFPTALIETAPHPWLITEDSAHTYASVAAVLAYFDQYLRPGDALVIEDGSVADLPGQIYRRYEDGPNQAVAEFLTRTGPRYVINREQCDFYGPNVTWAPNGWLRRV